MVFDIVGYFIDPAKTQVPGQLFTRSTRCAPTIRESPALVARRCRFRAMKDPASSTWVACSPPEAKSIAFNIIAVDTGARGFFSVTPGDEATYQSSTINWSGAGQVIDNGQFVALAPDGTIKVFNGSAVDTNMMIDVLGYFTDQATSFTGDHFFPLNPVRAYDSRAAAPAWPSGSWCVPQRERGQRSQHHDRGGDGARCRANRIHLNQLQHHRSRHHDSRLVRSGTGQFDPNADEFDQLADLRVMSSPTASPWVSAGTARSACAPAPAARRTWWWTCSATSGSRTGRLPATSEERLELGGGFGVLRAVLRNP